MSREAVEHQNGRPGPRLSPGGVTEAIAPTVCEAHLQAQSPPPVPEGAMKILYMSLPLCSQHSHHVLDKLVHSEKTEVLAEVRLLFFLYQPHLISKMTPCVRFTQSALLCAGIALASEATEPNLAPLFLHLQSLVSCHFSIIALK